MVKKILRESYQLLCVYVRSKPASGHAPTTDIWSSRIEGTEGWPCASIMGTKGLSTSTMSAGDWSTRSTSTKEKRLVARKHASYRCHDGWRPRDLHQRWNRLHLQGMAMYLARAHNSSLISLYDVLSLAIFPNPMLQFNFSPMVN
jgi:hypothetical protein